MSGDDLDAARRELTDRVMGRPGVAGTAVGEKDGRPCLVVYLDGRKSDVRVPGSVGGFPVVVEKGGPFRRF